MWCDDPLLGFCFIAGVVVPRCRLLLMSLVCTLVRVHRTGLPPVLMFTGECEVLLDQQEAFLQRLETVRVCMRVHVWLRSCVHEKVRVCACVCARACVCV